MERRALARTGHLALLSSVLVLLGACLGDPLLDAEAEEQVGSGQLEIVGGEVTSDLPSSGMLVIGGSPEVAVTACSATLVGCNKVLTAGRCVCDRFGDACQDPFPRFPTHAYFQHAGFFRVDHVEVHPDFNESAEHDIAILTLTHPVRGIRPAPMATQPVTPGSDAVIAGFGRIGGDARELGIKRRGAVTTTDCTPDIGVGKLCWRFDGTEQTSESNVCHGDAGGSTYIERDGRLEVVGVHSTTALYSCLEDPRGESADTGVFAHRDFLAGRVIDPPLEQCGDLPQFGDEGVVTRTESGSLELGEGADFPLEVPPGTAELRVTMNASDAVGADFDLYVMAGAVAGPGRFDCKAAGTSTHGFCEIPSPAPGTWHVHVVADDQFAQVGGQFQLTTTLFASAPIADDDGYGMVAGEPLVVDAGDGVLGNDTATERGPLEAVLDRPPDHGTVELQPDGSFVYTPEDGFAGPDSFRYRASDRSYSGLATVRIGVTAGDPERIPDDGGCAAGGSTGGAWLALLLLVFAARSISRSGLPWRR
jgi:hypothetical protein